MLCHLTLRDFVIVDRLELEFGQGFGTLTGETGAGKSILVDALALALGERADAGVVRSGADKAEVVATFDIAALPMVRDWLAANDLEGDDEVLLRRVVDAGGRSRAYINGSPATLQQLREVAEHLVDIHGQHAHQSLLRADAQRALVDAHGGLTALAREVAGRHRVWRESADALKVAREGGEALQREKEQLEWQVEELSALAFSVAEWQELEAEHKRLAHAASLIEGAQFALGTLADGDGACEAQVDTVASRLDQLADYDPGLADIAGLVASARTELAEAVSSLRRYVDRVDLDPSRLSEVERRIDAIHGCARKYRTTPEGLEALLRDSQAHLDTLQKAADLFALEQAVSAAAGAYRQLAQELSAGRRATAGQLAEAVSSLMQQLALGSGRLEVALVPLEEGASYGLEQVEFRVAGLSGNDARPLAKVVSGGELSRISLAIQVVTSRSAAVPTLIFDEVDVGIGGGVAEIVGRLLHDLGRERQVLCVTHLPQVAARADHQWQVAKSTVDGQVRSRIVALDREGRISEIARMLGGVEITEITRRHAGELLGLA